MKTKTKIFLGAITALTAAAGGGLLYLNSQIKQPSPEAQTALREALVQEDGYYFPSTDESKPMLIFYPGAAVEVSAYSVWAQEVAAAGYPVYLVNMPFQLSFFDPSRAQDILKLYPKRHYVMAGHSLGGAMASRFAAKQLKAGDPYLSGLIYLASYTDKSSELRNSQLPALSITGSEDKDIKEKDVFAKKADYPKMTEFISIKGGNHLGFANVAGAKPADISFDEQNEQVAKQIIAWLKAKV